MANDDIELQNGQEIADCLNEQFHSVFTKGARLRPLPFFAKRSANSIQIDSNCFKKKDVLEELNLLLKTKSPGFDNVHPYVLRECMEPLSLPLSLVYKISFISGQIPSTWKKANVCPIYKKGIKSFPSNYRPV